MLDRIATGLLALAAATSLLGLGGVLTYITAESYYERYCRERGYSGAFMDTSLTSFCVTQKGELVRITGEMK
jgi:hypothetical protein